MRSHLGRPRNTTTPSTSSSFFFVTATLPPLLPSSTHTTTTTTTFYPSSWRRSFCSAAIDVPPPVHPEDHNPLTTARVHPQQHHHQQQQSSSKLTHPSHNKMMDLFDASPVNLSHDLVFRDLRVEEMLRKKKLQIPTTFVRETDTVGTAIAKMYEQNVGGVLVEDKQGKLAGIFTERDLVKGIAVHGPGFVANLMQQVMTKHVISVHKDNTALECMSIMSERRVRHLPVCEKQGSKDLLGILSIGDLVVTVVREFHTALEFYREYIEGKYSATISPPEEKRQQSHLKEGGAPLNVATTTTTPSPSTTTPTHAPAK